MRKNKAIGEAEENKSTYLSLAMIKRDEPWAGKTTKKTPKIVDQCKITLPSVASLIHEIQLNCILSSTNCP